MPFRRPLGSGPLRVTVGRQIPMKCFHDRHVWVAVAAFLLVVAWGDLKAQTTTATTATSSATGMGTGMGFGGGGMGLMPMLSATNPTASLSPTDAAALGVSN